MNQSELEAVLVNGKFRNTNTLVSIPLLIGQENGGKDFNNAWAIKTEDVEELLSACYRQSSLLRSYCLNLTSFLASLHGIFWMSVANGVCVEEEFSVVVFRTEADRCFRSS